MTVAINMVVGEVGPPATPFWAKCPGCGECWTVCYLPMEMSKAAKLMGKAACPRGCRDRPMIAKQDNGALLEVTPEVMG